MAGEGGHGAGEVDGQWVWPKAAGLYSQVKSRHDDSGRLEHQRMSRWAGSSFNTTTIGSNIALSIGRGW